MRSTLSWKACVNEQFEWVTQISYVSKLCEWAMWMSFMKLTLSWKSCANKLYEKVLPRKKNKFSIWKGFQYEIIAMQKEWVSYVKRFSMWKEKGFAMWKES